jgi:prepilin peptidase CpaA
MTLISSALAALVAALLIWGAVTDVRSAKIPNWVIVVALALALLATLASGGFVGLGLALAALAIAFPIGFVGFAIRAIGGGDAKFLMVGAAFVGLHQLVPYLVATAALGGVLAVAMIVWRRRVVEATVMTTGLFMSMVTLGRKGYRGRLGEEGRIAVPYGVPIAVGALVVYFTPFADWLLR